MRGGIAKGHEETLGIDECVHYLDCGVCFYGCIHMSKLKMYTLNICSLLYVNYTSVKLLKILLGYSKGLKSQSEYTSTGQVSDDLYINNDNCNE